MAGVANLIDMNFPSMAGEMLSYLNGSKNPEAEKAFLDYQYLLGHYQELLKKARAEPGRRLAEQSFFDEQREKWADMTTSIAGPGNYENRKNQARQRFEGLMRANNTNADRSPDYEWLNESDDEDVFEDRLNN